MKNTDYYPNPASCIRCHGVAYRGDFGRVYYCRCGNAFSVNPKSISIEGALKKLLLQSNEVKNVKT